MAWHKLNCTNEFHRYNIHITLQPWLPLRVSRLEYNGNASSTTGTHSTVFDQSWSGVYINPTTLTNNFTPPHHVGIIAGQLTYTVMSVGLTSANIILYHEVEKIRQCHI